MSRLDSLSQSELNRRSSRLLGLMKDNRTDAEIECARITLLRCYAAVAREANPSLFLPKIEDGLMQWLIVQLNTVKVCFFCYLNISIIFINVYYWYIIDLLMYIIFLSIFFIKSFK